MTELFIADATLRFDGKQTEQGPSFREKLEIAKALDRLRLYGIELPALRGEKADALLVKSIALSVRRSRLILPAGLTREGVDAAWAALREAERPCLQIAVPTSTVQMEYLCHRKPAKVLELIAELVAYAKSLGAQVEFAADDATRSERDFLYGALTAAAEAGADTVVLCDTAGRMLPDEFGAFVRSVRENVPALSGRLLGVECSDALHMAAASAIAAAQNGAGLIRVSVCGGGLPALPDLSEILRVRGADAGLSSAFAVTELNRIAKQIDWILHSKRSSGSPFDNGAGEPPVGGPKLDAGSTQAEIIAAVRRLGYDLSEEDNAKVYDAFRLIAAKKDVGEKELDAIVASAALQVPPTYTLESYVINCGNIITATTHMKLRRQDKVLQGFGLGDGPVDASFLAIEQIIGRHYELDDFQIQAVTEGREAMGSALIRLRSGGKLYSGKGISTDVIGASIRAYLNALNKIAYEERLRQ